MSLFVKNSDIAIVGVKVLAEAIHVVGGLTDDGYPILGEVSLMNENPEMVFENGNMVYVTAEGDTYPDSLVEDRRDDGSVKQAIVMAPARPITEAVRATWRNHVNSRQTVYGLQEWFEFLCDEDYLKIHGLYVSARDRNINQAHEGIWQVAEHYMPGTLTMNASNGPWAIVSNDKKLLIKDAIEQVRALWP